MWIIGQEVDRDTRSGESLPEQFETIAPIAAQFDGSITSDYLYVVVAATTKRDALSTKFVAYRTF